MLSVDNPTTSATVGYIDVQMAIGAGDQSILVLRSSRVLFLWT